MAEVGALRVTLGLDSIDFTKGMTDINRKLRALDGEFKAITTGANKFDDTLEQLKSQSDVLNRSLEAHGAKVAELKRKYQDSARVKGEEARETQLLLIQYNKAVTAMSKVENQLKETERRIETQSSAWRRLGEALENTHTGLAQIGSNLQMTGMNLAASFGAATASIAAGLGLASKKAIDFEAQMSSVQSVMSVDEAKRFGKALEDLAITMGEDTKYSSLEAAQGIEELIKAGVQVEDIINGGLEASLNLATAGELDLAQAAEIASTALNAFRKDGLNAEQAANLLAGAANASATKVDEMQIGLSQVAAVASGIGLSFKDTSTALAVFAQNGLKGSDAGTSLKTMLNNLIPKTEGAAEAMMELGLMTTDGSNSFFDAQGNIKSMADISDLLKTSMKNLTAEQRQLYLYTMFGSDAIRAANILYEEGADGINKMYSEMSKVTAADVAAKKMDNLKGKIEELRGAFETALISLGTALMPLITKMTEGLQKLVKWFNNLSPAMQKLIAISGVISAALLGIVTVIGIVLTLVGGAIAGFGALSGAIAGAGGMSAIFASAIAAITSPISLAIGAIIALGAGMVTLYKKNKEFRDSMKQFWDALSDRIEQFGNWISPYFNKFLSGITKVWDVTWNNNIKKILEIALDGLITTVQVFTDLVNGDWEEAWNKTKTFFSETLTEIGEIAEARLKKVAETVKTKLEDAKKASLQKFEEWKTDITNWFTDRKTDIENKLTEWKNTIVTWFSNQKKAIVDGLNEWKIGIENWFATMPGVIKSKLIEWKEAIIQWTEEQNEENKRQFGEWGKSIEEWFASIPEKISTKLTDWKNTIVNWYDETKQNIITKLTEWGTSIETWFTEMPGKISAKFTEWKNAIVTWYDQTKADITTKLGEWGTSIETWFKNMPSNIRTWFDEWKNDMSTKFTETKTMITTKLDEWYQSIKTWFTDLPNKPEIKNAGKNMVDKVSEGNNEKKQDFIDKLGELIVDGIVAAVTFAGVALLAAGREVIKRIIDGIEETDFSQIGSDIISGIISGMGSMFGSLKKKAEEVATTIKKKIQGALKIESPSKVMADEVGKWIPAGIAEGMEKNMSTVINASKKMADIPVSNLSQPNAAQSASIGNTYNFYPQKAIIDEKEVVRSIQRLEVLYG